MPLSAIQAKVLRLTAENRSKDSHLARASGIHMAPNAIRISHDLDLFHDSEEAVAEAFNKDTAVLAANGFTIKTTLSQPGFIRAQVSDGADSVLIDWARDSIWRFLEPVRLAEVGWVLHPVDLAVNKVLALAGRDEPRDFLDTLYLHENVLHLGALAWAAAGKDPGLNPHMLLELLQRKGLVTKEEIARLDLQVDLEIEDIHKDWKQALSSASEWIEKRPASEVGCLYSDPDTGKLIAPEPEEEAEIIRGRPEGVMPTIQGVPATSFTESPELQHAIENFFFKKLME